MATPYPGMGMPGRYPAPAHANFMSYYPNTDYQQAYGAVSFLPDADLPQKHIHVPPGFRKRLNVLALSAAVFAPWLLFCGVLTLMSFSSHYNSPQLVYTADGMALLVVLYWGASAVISLKRDSGGGPSWYFFMFFSGLIAWFLAISLGNANFFKNLQPFYDVQALNVYHGVDPAKKKGQQMMDAGRIIFLPTTRIDFRRAWSFKDVNTYCVAPISTVTANGTMTSLASYDFWAVGLNCCAGDGQDFRCGEVKNHAAHAGMRLTRDDERPYYRLAVQQALSAHNIKAAHPLFLYWMEDPIHQVHDFKREGYKYVVLGLTAHFSLQLLLVTGAVLTFAKGTFWNNPDA